MSLTLVGNAEYGDQAHDGYNAVRTALGGTAAAAASQGLCGDDGV